MSKEGYLLSSIRAELDELIEYVIDTEIDSLSCYADEKLGVELPDNASDDELDKLCEQLPDHVFSLAWNIRRKLRRGESSDG
jgi:hypothetical protein